VFIQHGFVGLQKRVAPAGVSTLHGPEENEESYERIVAAEVVTKKKEKNETKSANVVEHGSAAVASDSHECGAEREKVEEKLFREKGNAEPGHSFFEISNRGPGWVTSSDTGAESKCKPGAAGQCQDLGRLADHASSAVGSTEDESLHLTLINLNSAARYR
jgi:hypothetical protein